MYNLKATQMNMQSRLIQKLMLNKFKLTHNAMEAIKNICCAKGDGTIDPSNQMVQEILIRLQKP